MKDISGFVAIMKSTTECFFLNQVLGFSYVMWLLLNKFTVSAVF